jgi:hypothetical protein
VTRGFLPASRTTGISTVSMLPPAPSPHVSLNTSLRVPSWARATSCSSRPPSTEAKSLGEGACVGVGRVLGSFLAVVVPASQAGWLAAASPALPARAVASLEYGSS